MNPTQDILPETTKGQPPVIQIHDVQIQTVNRSPKDIDQWRSAHVCADSNLNPNRARLYDIYADILVDGHLSGIVRKRLDAVLNKTIHYQDRDGKKVPAMDAVINSVAFRNIVRKIMDSVLWGISGIEFIPGDELAFVEVPRKHIKPKWRIISLQQNGTEGIPYDDHANIWIIGENQDLGLLLGCAPYAIYKRGVMADWANYTEVFGVPMRIIEYDANDEQTKIELKQILDESGSALALMIPKQANFKTVDGKQSNGDGQLQNTFKDALNAEMSLIILGNTETSTQVAGGGTNAKAKTHQEQQNGISKSDVIFTANTLNSKKFIAILKSYGLPVTEGGRFVFDKDFNTSALRDRFEIDKGIKTECHVPISDDYFYETYGIPKPENYQQLKAGNQQQWYDDEEDEDDTLQYRGLKGKKNKSKKYKSHSRLANLVNALKDIVPFFGPARV